MDGLDVSEILDLTRTTLEDLPDMTFSTPQKYQEYVGIEMLMKNKVQISSGHQIKRNIVLTETSTGQHVKMYESRQLSLVDRQNHITSPWAMYDNYWFIERHEALINSQPAAFVSLLQTRRENCEMNTVNDLEEAFWNTVTTSDDTRNPRGVFYWVTIGADGEDGFYGGQTRDRSGTAIASVGGITPVDLDRWCNYYADYAGPNSADAMVKAMHKTFRKIRFKAPRFVKDLEGDTPLSKYGIFMDGDTVDAYEEYTRKSNDNIGYDVGKFAGATAFQRRPITWVPLLDDVSSDIAGTNPILFLNFNDFFPYVLRGDYFRESPQLGDVTMHNVVVTFIDLSYNFICKNRRTQGLMATL